MPPYWSARGPPGGHHLPRPATRPHIRTWLVPGITGRGGLRQRQEGHSERRFVTRRQLHIPPSDDWAAKLPERQLRHTSNNLGPPVGRYFSLDQLNGSGDIWDGLYDVVSASSFAIYMYKYVLGMSGVRTTNAGDLASGVPDFYAHPDGSALAYSQPVFIGSGQQGWNSGDLLRTAGFAGLHLSVNDLLNVMGAFRRGGKIVSPTQAYAMLTRNYGTDVGSYQLRPPRNRLKGRPVVLKEPPES